MRLYIHFSSNTSSDPLSDDGTEIFIELTLKTEQDEYVREKIKWTPIQYL